MSDKVRKFVIFVFCCFVFVGSVGAEVRQPNIVLFYVDDLGWSDLGYSGSSFYESSNVDLLATEGVVFDNAYACAPNCAPSRACLMSGMYGPRHGVYTVGTAARGKSGDRKLIPVENQTVLNDGIETLPEQLK
ncbi:MAG: sulfatase-like hydrolase/transferase, partial [Planctomycetota bacterium]|nr:sulfatase-like hydrolase/transferase [Planctomycetota bacterium]